jgi:hypothetical protein
MQPMAGAPPVPAGAVALDAWRELDRETRRELLRGDRPHPDPSVAVVAVGYARTMLARSVLRQTLPLTVALVGAIVTYAVVLATLAANGRLPASQSLTSVLPALLIVPFVLVRRFRLRGRIIALHRMESINAAALWNTERAAPLQDRPGPFVPPSGAAAANPAVVRYSRRYVGRSLLVVAAVVIGIEAMVLGFEGGLVAVLVTTLLVLAVGLTAYNVVTRTRPWLPMMIMDAGGIELPSMGVRLSWAEVGELQIHPFRAGRSGKKGRHHVVAFVLTDHEAFRAQLTGWWAKKTRTPLSVYGTPLVIADLALDHSAEQIAAAAAGFTSAPIRRFGP